MLTSKVNTQKIVRQYEEKDLHFRTLRQTTKFDPRKSQMFPQTTSNNHPIQNP